MSRVIAADVPEILRGGGLRVGVVPDFGSNGHGPMRSVDGHLVHHTVGYHLRAVYAWPGRWDDVRPAVPSPRCNLWWPADPDDPDSGMGRDVWCVSAGLAYHAGAGSTRALADIRAGRVSARTANAYDRGLADDGAVGAAVLLGHEVENGGTAQYPYPPEQVARLAFGIHLINQAAGLTPGHVGHHRQYTRRKGDMSFGGDLWTLIARARTTPTEDDDMALDPATKAYFDRQFAALAGTLGVVIYGDDRDDTGSPPDTHPDNLQRIRRDMAAGFTATQAALKLATDAINNAPPGTIAGEIDYDEVQRRAEAAVREVAADAAT